MAQRKEFVVAGTQSQNCVRLRLSSQQLKELAQKIHVMPLNRTQKPVFKGNMTERRYQSTGKTRKVTRKKSPLSSQLTEFAPAKATKGLSKWKFAEEASQPTPKFSTRSTTPVSQLDTESSEPLVSSRTTALHSEIEAIDKRIQQEILFQDAVNSVPLEQPSPLLLPSDLMSSYKQALRDIDRMKCELEMMRNKEQGIMALNVKLKDTLRLQERRNQLLRTAK